MHPGGGTGALIIIGKVFGFSAHSPFTVQKIVQGLIGRGLGIGRALVRSKEVFHTLAKQVQIVSQRGDVDDDFLFFVDLFVFWRIEKVL